MVLAQGILVEQHWVGFLPNFSLPILVILLIIFELLLANDLFILKVDIEQDLSCIFLQKICVRAATFKHAKGVLKRLFKEIISTSTVCRRLLLSISTVRLLLTPLAKEDGRHVA